MATKIQLRRDTAANWTSANPTLSQGELGYETDTDKVKIGDGTTAWASLGYLIDGTAGAETDPVVGAISGIVKADGAGNISVAVAGTDYQAPLTSGVDYQAPLTSGVDYQAPLTSGVDYQAPLVSGTDIKTINGSSILGSGDLTIAGGSGISLTDISVGAPLPASGGGELNYDTGSGVFTFTPAAVPDFTSISVIVDDSDLTSLAASVEDLITQLQGLGV